MSIPPLPRSADDLGRTPAQSGNLPGTEHGGVIFLEYVNLERKVSGVWTSTGESIPATFEPVRPATRASLAAWTHKPLHTLWLPPAADVLDADRAIRFDGSRWYVRGTPLAAPGGTHVAALVEGAEEDGLFSGLDPAEPA